jgi:hypothetical protein
VCGYQEEYSSRRQNMAKENTFWQLWKRILYFKRNYVESTVHKWIFYETMRWVKVGKYYGKRKIDIY